MIGSLNTFDHLINSLPLIVFLTNYLLLISSLILIAMNYSKNKVSARVPHPLGDTQFDGPIFGDPEDEELYGDLEVLSGDIEPAELGAGDIEEILAGAPAARVVARKIAKGTTLQRTTQSMTRPQAAKVMASSVTSPLTVPGAAISAARIPALIASNAQIISFGVERPVAGSLLKYNLDAHAAEFVSGSIAKAAAGAGAGATTTLTFAPADRPLGFDTVSSPLIFLVISASQLNARAGARYEVSITGAALTGGLLNGDVWTVERINAYEPIRLTFIPTVRYKDTVRPVRAIWGGQRDNADVSLVVKVKDALADETVQIILPGMDSQELRAFQKAWNIPL